MPTSTLTPEALETGVAILKHVIESLEEKHKGHKVTRPDSLGFFDTTDYDILCEVSYLFATNGRNGHTGQTEDGTRWNAGMTLSNRRDEDDELIYEPVFGFFDGGLNGGIIWQGAQLIERVRDALKTP